MPPPPLPPPPPSFCSTLLGGATQLAQTSCPPSHPPPPPHRPEIKSTTYRVCPPTHTCTQTDAHALPPVSVTEREVSSLFRRCCFFLFFLEKMRILKNFCGVALPMDF